MAAATAERTSAGDERATVLAAFARTLRRETHVLQNRPDLLWQQLYNRLRWEEDPVPGLLEPQLQRRSAPGASPWLRTRTRLRESEALRLTLSGHTDRVKACAISPDSGFVVTASFDNTCKIWDAATGRERATLSGHTGPVNAFAISPDSDFVVTASFDKTCKIWDAATGRERATLSGHTNWVEACAISPDSDFVVTTSFDKTCKIWDAVTGRERATLSGHTDGVYDCAISPDSDFIVSASSDNTCKIWDAVTGRERATLSGHTDLVNACAISPDSDFIVSASHDKTCKIWDAATGRERASLPLLGAGFCVALQGWQPFAACGDAGGNVYLIDLVGIEYGPIIVTAIDRGDGLHVRCPICREELALEEGLLGEVVDCPQPGCEGRMRINPFTTKLKKQKPPRRALWRRKTRKND